MCLLNGDLVVVMTDLTPDCNLLGKSGIIDSEEIILHNQRIGKIVVTDNQVSKQYLKVYFNSNLFSLRMKETATGSTVRHTSVSTINESLITLPKLTEQKNIAKTLANGDKLIENIGRLIDKKRDFKQGTMQELLTGKTRLPGFSGEWNDAILFNLIDPYRSIRYGIVQPGDFDQNGRYMIRGQDYSLAKGWAAPSEVFKVSEEVEKKYKNARVKTGDLIMTIVGYCGHVEEIPDWLNEANLTQTTVRIAIHSGKANNRYCRYALMSEYCQKQVGYFLKGAAQPGLNCADVEKFVLQMPPSIEEQEAIAEILSDMDAEITVLEQRLEKTKAIKQGMMQQLLTGRIRLVEPSTPVEANA